MSARAPLFTVLGLACFVGCSTAAAGPVGGEFPVNTSTEGSQGFPSISAAGNGGFVVVWESLHQDNGSNAIYGQRYDSTGLPLESEFKIGSTSIDVAPPAVARLSDGGFVVTWTASRESVSGKHYDVNGLEVGATFKAGALLGEDQFKVVSTAGELGKTVSFGICLSTSCALEVVGLAIEEGDSIGVLFYRS